MTRGAPRREIVAASTPIEPTEVLPPAKRSLRRTGLAVQPERRQLYPLSDAFVTRLPAPDPSGKQRVLFDRDTPGFGVLVSGTTGAKSWVAQRAPMPRKVIERVALLREPEAREIAERWLRLMKQGVDPKAHDAMVREAQEAEAAKWAARSITLRQALDRHLATGKMGELCETTKRTYRKLLETHCADWLDQPVSDLTVADIRARPARIVAAVKARGSGTDGKGSAITTLRIVRTLIGVVMDQQPGLIGFDPRSAFRKLCTEPEQRTRRVKAERLAEFWSAVGRLENDAHRDAIRLLLFTGARRDEMLALRWDEVNLEEGTITLSPKRNKSKRTFVMPLSTVPLDILARRRAIGRDISGFVFPSFGETGHIRDVRRALDIVGAEMGLTLSAHDLRRTYATTARRIAKLPLDDVKALLNHSRKGDVTLRYIGEDEDDLREAQRKVGAALAKLCGISEPAKGKVAKLGRKRAA